MWTGKLPAAGAGLGDGDTRSLAASKPTVAESRRSDFGELLLLLLEVSLLLFEEAGPWSSSASALI